MPMYDYECPDCKQLTEVFTKPDDDTAQPCPVCATEMKRVLSWGGQNVFREEAPWVETCREVIPKDTTDPTAKQFLAEPNRTNLKAWMRANGLRHFERGEEYAAKRTRMEREQAFERRQVEEIMAARQKNRRIEL